MARFAFLEKEATKILPGVFIKALKVLVAEVIQIHEYAEQHSQYLEGI